MARNTFTSSGIRKVDFNLDETVISQIRTDWQEYASTIKVYPLNKFKGKGIVMSAGGISYFTCAWISISQLRKGGCKLPIELWYMEDELSPETVDMLQTMEVVCRDYLELGTSNLTGVMLKPLAIIASKFEEVLFIDADNNCLKDPEFLFESMEYLQTGAVFWPDYWRTARENPIWAIIDNDEYDAPEQESGQILVNKKTNWKELNLCLYFNINNGLYYKMSYGDKDTFKFAWNALKTPFHMIKKGAGTCGYLDAENNFSGTTIVQHAPDNEILFLHRNLLKWNETHSNEARWVFIKGFMDGAVHKRYELRYSSNSHYYINLIGDTYQYSDLSILDYENDCLLLLTDLRKQPFYLRFLNYAQSK